MAITEMQRATLARDLIETVGMESAETLMNTIIPEGRESLSTKDDVRALTAKTEAGFALVGAQFESVDAQFENVKAQFENVKAQFESVNAQFENVKAQFESVNAQFESVNARFESVDARFDQVDAEFVRLRGEVALMLAKQTRTVLLAVGAMTVATWGAILASFLVLASMIG